MTKRYYPPRCCCCGKFCVPADWSMPFDTTAIEPPDEEAYCQKCVEWEIAYHTEAGWMPQNCHKAKWEYVVAEKLGFILIALPGAAWSLWHKDGTPIPEGFQVKGKEMARILGEEVKP